jgi:hypothetical protein
MELSSHQTLGMNPDKIGQALGEVSKTMAPMPLHPGHQPDSVNNRGHIVPGCQPLAALERDPTPCGIALP